MSAIGSLAAITAPTGQIGSLPYVEFERSEDLFSQLRTTNIMVLESERLRSAGGTANISEWWNIG